MADPRDFGEDQSPLEGSTNAAARALDNLTRQASRFSQLVQRSVGPGGRPQQAGGVTTPVLGQAFLAGITANTAAVLGLSGRLAGLTAAMDRVVAATRTSAVLSGVGAVATVRGTSAVQASIADLGMGVSDSTQAARASRSSTPEQRQRRRESAARLRGEKADTAARSTGKKIRGVPLELASEAAEGLPPIELQADAPLDPALERAGFLANEAEERRRKEADFEARMKKQGVEGPELEKRRKASQRMLDQGEKKRLEEFDARQATRQAAAQTRGMSPLEMTPQELAALPVVPKKPAPPAAAATPAGGLPPGLAPLVAALEKNTQAVLAASKGGRGGR